MAPEHRTGRRHRSPRLWIGAALCLAFLLALVLARAAWLPLIGGFLVVSDPLAPADAVVPLGGGERDRVVQAAALVVAGDAHWLVTTESELDLPGIRDPWHALVRREARWQGVPAERILDAPGLVTTTYGEAQAVRRLAAGHGWRSLIVVTDPLHSRRARLVFREVFRDAGIRVIVRPVDAADFTAANWWRSEEGLRYAWTEYLKLVYHLLSYRPDPWRANLAARRLHASKR